MGWLFGHHSRRDLITHITKSWGQDTVALEFLTKKGIAVAPDETHESYRSESVCLTKQYKGGIRSGTLYGVWENRVVRKATNEVVHSLRWIRVDLLKYYTPRKDDWCPPWGYKDMDESMGPCEVSCPLKYLDMVPDPGGYATKWREEVRVWHAARKRYKAKHGEKVALKEGVKLNGDPLKWVIYQSYKKGGIALTPWNSPVVGVNKHIAGPYVETNSGELATASS